METVESSSTRREILRRFLELPQAEQLDIVGELQELVTISSSKGPEARAVDNRRQALVAVQRAVEHLCEKGELTTGARITARQFDDAARDLGLEVGRSAIIRAFGLWRDAVSAAVGEPVIPGPAHRRAAQAARNRSSRYLDPVEALRLWLETEPASRRQLDYRAFAEVENPALVRAGRPPLPDVDNIRTRTSLPWKYLVEVVGDGVSIDEARQRYLDGELAGLSRDHLIGSEAIGVILNLPTKRQGKSDDPRFPARAAMITRRIAAWRLGDILDYRDGKPIAHQSIDFMQARTLTLSQLTVALGLNKATLRRCVRVEDWSRVPEPRGSVARTPYWSNDRVDSWLEDRLGVASQGNADG